MANMKPDSPFIIHDSTLARSASSTPYGNRTRVLALRGLCPRPLDERGAARRKRLNVAHLQPIVNPWQGSTEAPPGFEPGVEDLQSSALPLGHGAGTTRAGNRARTGDLNLGKVALYQLSYARERTRIVPRSNGIVNPETVLRVDIRRGFALPSCPRGRRLTRLLNASELNR